MSLEDVIEKQLSTVNQKPIANTISCYLYRSKCESQVFFVGYL